MFALIYVERVETENGAVFAVKPLKITSRGGYSDAK